MDTCGTFVFCVLLYRWWVKYVDFMSVFKYFVPHNSKDTLLLPFSCVSIVEVLVLWLYKFTGPACRRSPAEIVGSFVFLFVCLFVCFFFFFFFLTGGGWGFLHELFLLTIHMGTHFLLHMMCCFLKHSSLIQNRNDRMMFVWSSSSCKYVGMELHGDRKVTQPIW